MRSRPASYSPAMSDTDHRALITEFYDAFSRCDAEAMAACYHDDVRFSDPVFTDLRGESAGNMWRMLCGRATDLKVEASNIAPWRASTVNGFSRTMARDRRAVFWRMAASTRPVIMTMATVGLASRRRSATFQPSLTW